MCVHHAQHLCTSTMYINIIQCAKRYHPWNVSIICLYQHANHVHPPIFQPCASTNMPTMCIHQYANHVHLLICQPCASTNMSTMCIYPYANHVHLPIYKPFVISLMICLRHEPSATIMYLKQMPIVVLIK